MTQAVQRRVRSRATPVQDVNRFRPVVDQALEAFTQDVSYAVHMARAAVTIVRKREVWQARRAARSRLTE